MPELYLEIIIEILLALKSPEDLKLNQNLTESYWDPFLLYFYLFQIYIYFMQFNAGVRTVKLKHGENLHTPANITVNANILLS